MSDIPMAASADWAENQSKALPGRVPVVRTATVAAPATKHAAPRDRVARSPMRAVILDAVAAPAIPAMAPTVPSSA